MLSVSGRRAGIRRVVVLTAALTTIAGCTIIQGDTVALERMKSDAPAATKTADDPAAINAPAIANLANVSVASAGIPIPLISPRHRDVRVASIDPRIGLSTLSSGVSIKEVAGVYLKYGDALGVAETSNLNTPKEVRRVLKGLRFSQPDTLANGWYAVRAMAAAHDALFSKGVREQVRIDGRDKVLASLDDPTYVLRIPGAGSATAAIVASASQENSRMIKLRQKFMDTAHNFQRQKWGMNEPSAADEGIVKAADATATDAPVREKLTRILHEFSPVTEAQAYSTAVMTKILAQGAREIISAPVTPVAMRSDETTTCLNWARLNLNQCIAAAHFPSEEAWCAGTHAIEEVRTCWAAALPAPAAP